MLLPRRDQGLYAKCPRSDKIKISKGIVAAVRELGGRFLELDERREVYFDIGDKKATEKTSQALREGQTKVRKEMYRNENNSVGSGSSYDTSLLTSSPRSPGTSAVADLPISSKNSTAANGLPSEPNGITISQEGYFGYSVQVLDALFNTEQDPEPEEKEQIITPETTNPSRNNTEATDVPNKSSNMAISQEGYFGYSMQVLEALFNSGQEVRPEKKSKTLFSPPSPLSSEPLSEQPRPILQMPYQGPLRLYPNSDPTPPAKKARFLASTPPTGCLPTTSLKRSYHQTIDSPLSTRKLLDSTRDFTSLNEKCSAHSVYSLKSSHTAEIRELILKSKEERRQLEQLDKDGLEVMAAAVELRLLSSKNSASSSEPKVSGLNQYTPRNETK